MKVQSAIQELIDLIGNDQAFYYRHTIPAIKRIVHNRLFASQQNKLVSPYISPQHWFDITAERLDELKHNFTQTEIREILFTVGDHFCDDYNIDLREGNYDHLVPRDIFGQTPQQAAERKI